MLKRIINQTNGFGNVSFHGRIYTSYKPRFTLLTFIIDIILQKELSYWYSVSKNVFSQTEQKVRNFFQALTSARGC